VESSVGEEHRGVAVWGTIDASPIVFPAVVHRMNSVRADFTAPIDAVEALVPGDVLDVVEIAPGTAFVSLILTHYLQADWGSFARASVVTSVRPRDTSSGPVEPGLYTTIGATSARFLNEVLYWVLGMHHVDCAADVDYGDGDMRFSFRAGADEALRVAAPLADRPPVRIMTTHNVGYSVLDRRALRTYYEVSTGAGAVDAAEVDVTLGPGPLGDALRSLGFAPASASWYSGKDMRMVLHEPSHDLSTP
jgi:hypothetical protein